MEPCELCKRVRERDGLGDFLLQLDVCDVFLSPFASRWPGALMVVFREHVLDLTSARSPGLAQANLLMVERAVACVVRPLRMNVVKFANACEHLHWHLIPRFADEAFQTQNSWELADKTFEEIHPNSRGSAALLRAQSDFQQRLCSALRHEFLRPKPSFFSAAIFLRPVSQDERVRFASASLEEIAADARSRPWAWESLLMRRNYADFGWDNAGGVAERGEHPLETLRREVEEELGWNVCEALEVTRQWQAGVVRGFVYLVRIHEAFALEGIPQSQSKEIGELGFHSLHDLTNSLLPNRVKLRVQAFLQGQSDFNLVPA